MASSLIRDRLDKFAGLGILIDPGGDVCLGDDPFHVRPPSTMGMRRTCRSFITQRVLQVVVFLAADRVGRHRVLDRGLLGILASSDDLQDDVAICTIPTSLSDSTTGTEPTSCCFIRLATFVTDSKRCTTLDPWSSLLDIWPSGSSNQKPETNGLLAAPGPGE